VVRSRLGPIAEVVDWLVLRSHSEASYDQIVRLLLLEGGNARGVEWPNGRMVKGFHRESAGPHHSIRDSAMLRHPVRLGQGQTIGPRIKDPKLWVDQV
jgi:hypothetical protein